MRQVFLGFSILASLSACSQNPAEFQGGAAAKQGNLSSANSGADAAGKTVGSSDYEGDGSSEDATAADQDAMADDDDMIIAGEDVVLSIPNVSTGSLPTNTSTDANAATNSGSNTTNTNNSSGTPPTTQAPAPITLSIEVPSDQVRSGSTAIQAVVKTSNGSPAPAVTWSVSTSGAQAPGTITDSGLYTAPASGGGYSVTLSASSIDNPALKATVVIKIIAPEQIFVGCQQGNTLFPITADVYQLAANTNKLPDFASIGAKTATVCMDQYNVSARDWSMGFPGVTGLYEWFALRTKTKIVIPNAGTYQFRLNSDDGAKLYIDGQLVIDNDGQHAPLAKDGSVSLSAGEHALVIDYFQGPRYQIALELFWKTPMDASFALVPKSSFH